MDQSAAEAGVPPLTLEVPAWKNIAAVTAAVLMASDRLAQALVPRSLALPGAIALGIAETFAGVLLILPRTRRWGAWLTGVLLLAFMVYIGINYNQLRGEECSCFPMIKRAVGPGFFISDAVMLGLALLAWRWSRPSDARRVAVLTLAVITVFAGVSAGVRATERQGLRAPQTVNVNGQPVSLQQGKVLIYFFDPECTHCLDAAKRMSKHEWLTDRVIGVPTTQPQFAGQFLQATNLKADVSLDLAKLREVFKFTDPPYAVAIENGQQVAAFNEFTETQPEQQLRQLGFIR
jgi:uncharacterized membrane protein YphA (DoxX/SURF4 family)